jgi:Peptidase S24-like
VLNWHYACKSDLVRMFYTRNCKGIIWSYDHNVNRNDHINKMMNSLDKQLLEQAKKVLNVRAYKDIALALGYKEESIVNWSKRGLSEVVKLKLGQLIDKASHDINNLVKSEEIILIPLLFAQAQIDSSEISHMQSVAIDKRALVSLPISKSLQAFIIADTTMNPTMQIADTAIIDTSDTTPINDKIYAINYYGDIMIKRAARYKQDMVFVGDNEDIEKVKFRTLDDGVKILGRVVKNLCVRDL